MKRTSKEICMFCAKAMVEADASHCSACGHPTMSATHEQRIEWEVGQWRQARPGSATSTVERAAPARAATKENGSGQAVATMERAERTEDEARTHASFKTVLKRFFTWLRKAFGTPVWETPPEAVPETASIPNPLISEPVAQPAAPAIPEPPAAVSPSSPVVQEPRVRIVQDAPPLFAPPRPVVHEPSAPTAPAAIPAEIPVISAEQPEQLHVPSSEVVPMPADQKEPVPAQAKSEAAVARAKEIRDLDVLPSAPKPAQLRLASRARLTPRPAPQPTEPEPKLSEVQDKTDSPMPEPAKAKKAGARKRSKVPTNKEMLKRTLSMLMRVEQRLLHLEEEVVGSGAVRRSPSAEGSPSGTDPSADTDAAGESTSEPHTQDQPKVAWIGNVRVEPAEPSDEANGKL